MRLIKVAVLVMTVLVAIVACQPELRNSKVDKRPEPEGAVVFNQACDNCHSLDRALAASGDEETWLQTLERMRDSYGAKLSAVDIESVVSYHVNRQKQEAQVFQDQCQRCHAGNSHDSKSLNREQVAALVKMMRQKAGRTISDTDAELIVNYHIREHRLALDNNVRGGLGLEKEILQPWQMIGRTLFLEKCSDCHDIQRAVGSIKDEQAWRISMKRMQAYSKGRLSTQEINSLVDFHVREQRRELQVFQDTCTSCHSGERFTSHSMSDEETLRMLRKMQKLAPDMITDDKVQVLFLFHQRQEKTFAGLFEGRCRKCHQVKARESLTLASAQQNLGTLVTGAESFFSSGLPAPDVSNLLTFHRERESREMAVFRRDCASCHDQAGKQQPSVSDRIMQISILQGRELNREVTETIKTQIGFHVLEKTQG